MKKIVICSCATHHRVAPAKIKELASRPAGDFQCEVISDLCGLTVREPQRLAELAKADFVIACFPRAVQSLFRFAGVELPVEKILDLRHAEGPAILAQLGLAPLATEVPEAALPAWTDAWTPWYPVIDQDRCIHCGKCADFCLFGVYSREKGQVKVTNPSGCKTNCPACARICPQSAIIFPKYDKSPINGGLAIEETLPVDPASIRKGGTYETLAARRRTARPLLQDPP
jgi:Pyruvate/2-oxoacid:ferredoxin oxidoreductase delta subunit